jgi:ABC-2 type transport system permease protein
MLLGSLGGAIGVLLYLLVGLAAFWLRRVLPATLIVQKLGFVLGGLLAPISLYPEGLFRFAEATPFAAHLFWVGVQTLTPSVRLFWIGLAWQLLWIAILALLCALTWQIGLRKVLREGL